MGEILIAVATVIGAFSIIGKALIPVVKLTATKKDDKILGKVNLVLEKIKSIIDKIGLNK